MRSALVPDELCKQGAQVLLNCLKVWSEELRVAAAAPTESGKLSWESAKV